ncbi:F-box/LRR-repeat protein 2 [Pseudocercospora fuligena]|uniref:F-box/LRR-repeat protein 2 n=1 Tax=Pseudocercospora fuligena TaxID=685502 RepID=A0A8H6R7M4_9PEZI|nr:F-box/LRR-repeat protein 2 [Pseudocercospora fuligena]
MASASNESVAEAITPIIESPDSNNIASPPFEDVPQPAPKLKGRQRLIAGLQRISSSPSVARLNGSRAKSYNGTGKGSISCISLNSASSYGSPSFGPSLTREFSAGYATPPTSAVTTPGVQIPKFDDAARLRYVSQQDSKLSVGLPSELRSKPGITSGITEVDEDYFSRPLTKQRLPRKDFNFWRDLPSELKMEILTYLNPKEVVRCSIVSKSWHEMCFDGQLWAILDTAGFYQDIPGDALVSIITSAGPFVRDLNLRGCVQLRERWNYKGLSDACTNLENFSLEGCRIDRASIHNFLWSNCRLVHINLSGLAGATNAGMKIIAQNCPKLEHLNISWCNNIDTRGLRKVIEGCSNLKDLRAGEIRGWDDLDFMHDVFQRNTLERLILMNCDTLTDESLAVLIEGKESEIDYISGRPIVPPRRFKHLDFTRCRGITDKGVRTLVNNIPEIEGLQLSKCHGILDATMAELLPTTPMLTHLDIEELEDLSNSTLHVLANSPCAKRLRHLSISYCENMGDTGMLPVLKSCTNLRSLEMDNTRIGDLVLAEAAAMVRERVARTIVQGAAKPGQVLYKPTVGLRLVAYDCQNVTWTGVREILCRNADVSVQTRTVPLPPLERSIDCSANSSAENVASPSPSRIHIVRSTTFPTEVIQLKCFYTYQPTVEEHFKRVMRGDFIAARRLERKWAEFMIASEEANALGGGRRRRERRARQAQMLAADEEDVHTPGSGVGGGRRRRARSGGCAVM